MPRAKKVVKHLTGAKDFGKVASMMTTDRDPCPCCDDFGYYTTDSGLPTPVAVGTPGASRCDYRGCDASKAADDEYTWGRDWEA